MVARTGSRRLVAAADKNAQELGLRVGMSAAHAQALCSDIVVAHLDEKADAASLEKVALWCLNFSPLVAPDPPDGVVLDVTGCAHLFGGEDKLLAEIVTRLEKASVTARVAISDTWAASWALARFGRSPAIAATNDQTRAIERFSVRALRIDHSEAEALRRVGMDTIGDLFRVPSQSLSVRFGRDLTRRLHQITGREREMFVPVFPPECPSHQVSFVEPLIHGEGIRTALSELARQISSKLKEANLGAQRFDLLLHRVDSHTAAVRVGASQPCSDETHLVRLFGDKTDAIDPGYGIEAMQIVASRTSQMIARQLDIRGAEDKPAVEMGQLVDRIAAHVGAKGVYRAAPVESDLPERAVKKVSALSEATGKSWPIGPRPSRIINPPEPIQVVALLPDHPPAFVIWQGKRERVRSADGPERVYGEWWVSKDEVSLIRDYFRIETESAQRLWVFRASHGGAEKWFIQGVFG